MGQFVRERLDLLTGIVACFDADAVQVEGAVTVGSVESLVLDRVPDRVSHSHELPVHACLIAIEPIADLGKRLQRTPAAVPSSTEQVVRARLRQISAAKPRWGWRKAYWVLRAEGQLVNHKRVRAHWLEEGLKRPAKARKRRRVGPRSGDRLTAQRPDHVWALDYQVDVTADGRQIRFCTIVEEFTREALATTAARSFTADDTVILLDKVIATTARRPQHLRMDNGPELTAAAMRDWCRFAEVATAFIEPGAPWQNGYNESFNAASATSC